MQIDVNSNTLLENRYLIKDINRKSVETPNEMILRVAKFIASAEDFPESYVKLFFDIMNTLKFLPSTPILANAGVPRMNCLSSCFVLGIDDTLESIFETLKNSALVFKQGGGVGINFSKLRPEGAILGSTKGESSGVISFMRLFDTMVDIVKQGGIRRGAMMSVLNVYHPEIEAFIESKIENSKNHKVFSNMNISVLIDNNFIKACNNDDYIELVNPNGKQVVKKVRALDIFEKIVKCSWKCGDPGVIFKERLNKDNHIINDSVECVNPCGEQPLLVNESCNLGSLNLEAFVKKTNFNINPLKFNSENVYESLFEYFDFEELERVTRIAVRFLDDVIDVGEYVIHDVDIKSRDNRKIGLGVMGFANLLYRLFIPYNDERALILARSIMKLIYNTALEESIIVGREKSPFPNIDNSDIEIPRRNSNLITIAPTGSISQIAGTSSGIEPNFHLAYSRNGFEYINKPILDYLKNKYPIPLDYLCVINKIIRGDMSLLNEEEKRVFITAHDLKYEEHIAMQEAFQENIDNAISKTINLKSDATIDDVRNVFLLSFKSNIKGITVFRDKCLDEQVVNKLDEKCDLCEGEMIFDGKCYRCSKCGYSNKCSV